MTIRTTLLSLGFLAAYGGPAAANETVFPQTRAARAKLSSIQTELTSLASRLESANTATEDTRKKVETASAAVKAIGATDDALSETIRQLKPVSSIPQLRALKTLVQSLESLKKKVHDIREQADKTEKNVFKPTREKLLKLERDLELTILEVKAAASRASLANAAIGATRAGIQQRGNLRGQVESLEALSRNVRVAITPVEAGVKRLDAAATDVEKVTKGISTALNTFNVINPAVEKLAKDLAPAGATARELGKVLSTKLAINLFGEEHGFTVRQILEGPEKIADFVLKPLEELADKALAPILKNLKIEIPLPREFEKIPESLTTVAGKLNGFDEPLAKLEKSLDPTFLKGFQKTLDSVKPPRK